MSDVLAERFWRARVAGQVVEIEADVAPSDEPGAYVLQHAITKDF